MLKKVLKNRLFLNFVLFIPGFLIMLRLQVSWLKAHEPEYIGIRLIIAPILTGLLLVLVNICIRNYKRWSYIAGHSSVIEGIFIGKNRSIRYESLYVFFLLLIILVLTFGNIVFMGQTFLTSPMCPGTMPAGPYKYEGPNGDRPVMDTGASAWQFEPWVAKVRQEILKMKWPLWNPNSGVGVPLLANMQSAPFSPFRIFIHIFPSPIFWDVFFFLRLIVAGLFTYLFLRAFNKSPIASLSSAIIFMFSGFNILYINMGHLDVDVLVPVFIFTFEWIFRDCRPRNIAFGSILVLFSIIGGMPESTFFVLLLTFGYYLFRTICQGIKEKIGLPYYIRKIYIFSLTVLMGLLLSGPQLFPFLEYLNNCWVSHSKSIGVGSNPLIGGIALIIPYFFGKIHQNWNDISSFSLGAYIGTLPLFLSLVAIFGKKFEEDKRLIYFFGGLSLFFICKYFGFFFINWIGYLPIFNRMIFEKYCIPEFSFLIAVLAGFGIEGLIHDRISKRNILISVWFLLGIVFIYLGIRPLDLFPQVNESKILEYVSIQVGIALLLIMIGCMVSLLTLKNYRKRLSIIFLVMLVFGEMIFYIPKDRAIRYDAATVPPFVKFLNNNGEKFRVLGMDSILYPNSSSFYNIDCITDLDAMYPLGYMSFIKECLSPKIYDRFIGEELPANFDKILRFLNLLNVKYLLANGPLDGSIREILEKSEFVPRNRWGINATRFNINGKTKSVLFQHPPSTISYPVYIPPTAMLSFSIAMSPECWAPNKGDGVGFRIKIKHGKYMREIFSKTIDPKKRQEERRWFDYSIDLSEYKNKNVNVIFETESLSNNAYDWAGWGDIILSSKSHLQKLTLVYDKEIKIFQNSGVFPRVFLVPQPIFAKDEKDALAILMDPRINLRKVVVLENQAKTFGYSSSNRSDNDCHGSAEIIRYESNEVIIKTDISNDGFLILTDLYFPGWKAYVDGRRQKILKADYLFRALYLQPGIHDIKFIYDPISFKIGWIAFFSAILTFGIFFILTRKGRPKT